MRLLQHTKRAGDKAPREQSKREFQTFPQLLYWMESEAAIHLAPEWGGPGNLGVHDRGAPDLERCHSRNKVLSNASLTLHLLSHPQVRNCLTALTFFL